MDNANDNEKSPKSSRQILNDDESDNVDEILDDHSENSNCDSNNEFDEDDVDDEDLDEDEVDDDVDEEFVECVDEDSDEDYDPDVDEFSMNQENYQEFLCSLFPSNYMKNKLNKLKDESSKKNKKIKRKGKKNNKIVKKTSSKKTSNKNITNKKKSSNKKNIKKKKSSNKKNLKKAFKVLKMKKNHKDFPTDEDELLDEQDEIDLTKTKFNIVYAFGDDNRFEPMENDEESSSENYDSYSEYDSEIEEIKKKKMDDVTEEEWEKVFRLEEEKMKREEGRKKEMIENLVVGNSIMVKKPYWQKPYKGTIKKIISRGKGKKEKKYFTVKLDNDSYELLKNIPESYLVEIKKKEKIDKVSLEIKELLELKEKNNEDFEKKINEYEKKFQKEKNIKKKKADAKQTSVNIKRLKKLLKDKSNTNDFTYFKKMELEDQKSILRNLVEINKISDVDMPYRLKLIKSDINPSIKSVAMKKVKMLSMMDPCSGEYYKNKLWVDTFMSIPFGVHNKLPVKYDDGLEKCREFMESAKETLDNAVYGLNDAKMQIMQMIGGWISNPNAVGTAIAIHGPMGTGKTTLVKEGISKILNRPFAFIPLGGATDSSFLEGHSYTYEGSVWGKIVDVLIHSKCMNPVFYFDELDKISDTPKGEEITGILTHLTDTTQNSQFHDKYFSNLDFDVSKALFIFSYNHEEKVNPILKDRMYRIKTEGYEKRDKKVIAQKYLIPSIMKNINFKEGEIIIKDEIIEHICDKYTGSEKGVRNLKRCLEIIYGKINLFRLLNADSKLFDGEVSMNVEFPFEVTTQIVDKLIKEQDKKTIPFGMYM